jgi:hypothetical protein
MKLDNVIYDVETLAQAITEQWNAESTAFQAMYPSDTATSLVNVMSAYGSMLQYCLVSAMANCYTDSAFSEAGVYQLADTLGNTLHGNVSSQVLVNLTKNNFIGITLTIPAHTQFIIDGKKFFNPTAIICPANVETVTEIVLVQGEIRTVNKVSSGIENEKFYFSTDFKCNHNYVTVKVNGEEWIVSNSFLAYDKNSVYDVSQMNVCLLHTDPDGRSYIKVGNDQLGNLPLSGSNIQIQYAANEGEEGNIAESGKVGSLLTILSFMDTTGNVDTLNVTVTTTTTAYGGFSKQTLETLQYTSPAVFASGDRAIRRQDYEAMLQNKCGYLTTAVWGEYEEADKVGAYDSLMMNMVYYTGIKSFQTYPYFTIGSISDKNVYGGLLNSTRGFWGSFSFRIQNLTNTENSILVQDTGAKGQLFINNNNKDPRDSLLPDWKNTIGTRYLARLPKNYIASSGSGYKANETLLVKNTNGELIINVLEINEVGGVKSAMLQKYLATENWSVKSGNPFATAYNATPGQGSGFTVNLEFIEQENSTLIFTNDERGMNPPPTQAHPLINARSDQDPNLYYQSLWEPTLLQPVQIIVKYNEAKAIAGIKFQAANPERGTFPGTIAMFGTNIDPMPSIDNLRNSENWDRVIDRTFINNPYGNENENWSDWMPTNCFKGTADLSGQPEYNRYKYYVIEFYSVDDNNTVGEHFVTFNKIKMLYEDDASVLYYDRNGIFEIRFPVAGSPGPGGTEDGYLTEDLLNTNIYPMYSYNIQLEGVTAANGYRDGNTLAYIFRKDDTVIPFTVDIVNIDNGVFDFKVNGSSVLSGTEYVTLNGPASLDETPVYKASLDLNESGQIDDEKGGQGYRRNDIVVINGTNNQLKLRVAEVSGTGSVRQLVWLNDISYGEKYEGEFDTTLLVPAEGSTGTGLKVTVISTPTSGNGINPGRGGTIFISSTNNLQVDATFTGNRIDTRSINNLDQPIINAYNHFTTFLEFKQPEITQVSIRLEAELSQTATMTSGLILQNIKNNVQKLFEVTPDYIGKGLKLSDIYTAVMNTPNVKWCRVLSPLDNVEVNKNGLLILSGVEITEVIQNFK